MIKLGRRIVHHIRRVSEVQAMLELISFVLIIFALSCWKASR